MSTPLQTAASRILAPLVRILIARGLAHPVLTELAKGLYVSEAERHFGLEARRLTDSRISVVTGLQRRDVKRLRAEPAEPQSRSMGPVPRVIRHWTSAEGWQDAGGAPLVLPRQGEAQSFAVLVAEVSRDVHPRTVLDALIADGAVEHDPEQDAVRLLRSVHLPRGEAGRLAYFGLNLGDHAEAAVTNLLSTGDPPPFFERAVHFNRLSPASIARLDAAARAEQEAVLARLAALAAGLQAGDEGRGDATGRFRCGAFVFHTDEAAKHSGDTPGPDGADAAGAGAGPGGQGRAHPRPVKTEDET